MKELTDAHTSEISKLNDSFNQKYSDLSLLHSKELQETRIASVEITKKLESEIRRNLGQMEANQWSSLGTTLHFSHQYGEAAGCHLLAATARHRYTSEEVDTIQANIESFLKAYSLTPINQIDTFNDYLTRHALAGPLSDYIEYFEDVDKANGTDHYVNLVTEIKALHKKKTDR